MRLPHRLTRYHWRLLAWHSRRFHPFLRLLSPEEKAYVRRCFALATGFVEETEHGARHFSYYTYSHRVRGDRVNSSRIAFGSISAPQAAWELARPVLAARGIDLDRTLPEWPRLTFYGLGWDFEAGDFKVYFRTADLGPLRERLAPLVALRRDGSLPEALVSVTYRHGEHHEDKLYFYETFDLPPGVRMRARMASSRRGLVEQYDLQDVKLWAERLNDAGRRILRRYREVGERLDTIAWQGPDAFTLYFP
ncbi:MAG: hypothetical protein D6776_02210 [Planctomycetota bacterium]|nr:MAG: hypothetical protein D6776_02210 [Planctomycetota bacterium]